jgi:hypothetical protein
MLRCDIGIYTYHYPGLHGDANVEEQAQGFPPVGEHFSQVVWRNENQIGVRFVNNEQAADL